MFDFPTATLHIGRRYRLRNVNRPVENAVIEPELDPIAKRLVLKVVLQAIEDMSDSRLSGPQRVAAQLFLLMDAEGLLATCGILVEITSTTLPVFVRRRKGHKLLCGKGARW